LTELRIGVVGVAGGWSTERLADALAERTGFRLVVELHGVSVDLAGGSAWYAGQDLCKLDALVIKKIGREYSPHMLDRIELLRFIESRGVLVFSKPERLIRVVDRLSCTVTLRAGAISMPDTLITEDIDAAARCILEYGGAVLKPLFSTKARGMQLVTSSDPDEVAGMVRDFRDAGNPVIYVQKKLRIPGRDLGLAFVGGRYLGAYARVAHRSSWNTTTHDGGRYERHEPSAELVAIARRAQDLFGLDFTTVDIVETDDGPMVFEVSAFGGFRGVQDSSGVDAAGMLAEHVIGRLRDGH
jgi:tetrahydromethanopterin:alpha-L-glutamate ligase